MSQRPNPRINRPDTFAEQRGSTAGLIGAVLIHISIVAATLFSFAHKLDITDESSPIVPVDLVTIGEKTNITPTITKKAETPADQEVQTPPQPDMLTPAPPPQEKAAEPAPSVTPPKAEALQPQKKPVPEQPKQDEKKQKFDINNIAALLNQQASKSAAPNAKVANHAVKGFGAQDAMTADLVTALQSQIYPCWSPPVGAPHPERLIVTFQMSLNSNGTVAQPPQLSADSAAAAASDPYMRAAAEAARRAIYTCAPYHLPANKYDQWRNITIDFDPRKMAGY